MSGTEFFFGFSSSPVRSNAGKIEEEIAKINGKKLINRLAVALSKVQTKHKTVYQ